MATGYVYDPLFLAHDLPYHPENAQRLLRIWDLLERRGIPARLRSLPLRPATLEELRLVHSDDLIERVRRVAAAGGGNLDPDTYVTPNSYDAALAAVGGTVGAVTAVVAGEVDNAFALVRPPGHHATRHRAMGFCLFNNIAIAARVAQEDLGLERVLIVDFDVHHGNGTQDALAQMPGYLYVSTHQYPHYPGTGHWRDTGRRDGAATALNVSLPAGVGDAGYARVWSELLWPLTRRFEPDLVLVSAGYDAHWSDPLAQMNLSLSGYARLQQELVQIAAHHCGHRIVFVLEGGYQLDVLAYGVLNAFYALLGDDELEDPLGTSPRRERSAESLVASLRSLHGLG